MKTNATKFNGEGSFLADEAKRIYEFVKEMLEANKAELGQMQEAVQDQLGGKKKKKPKLSISKSAAIGSASLAPSMSTPPTKSSSSSNAATSVAAAAISKPPAATSSATPTSNVIVDGVALGDLSKFADDSDSDDSSTGLIQVD